jgi:hypothetical protein
MTRKNSSAMGKMIDVAGAALYGTARGIEDHFEGDMAATGAAIDKALQMFLDDVTLEADEETAAKYAKRFMDTLACYAEDGGEIDDNMDSLSPERSTP